MNISSIAHKSQSATLTAASNGQNVYEKQKAILQKQRQSIQDSKEDPKTKAEMLKQIDEQIKQLEDQQRQGKLEEEQKKLEEAQQKAREKAEEGELARKVENKETDVEIDGVIVSASLNKLISADRNFSDYKDLKRVRTDILARHGDTTKVEKFMKSKFNIISNELKQAVKLGIKEGQKGIEAKNKKVERSNGQVGENKVVDDNEQVAEINDANNNGQVLMEVSGTISRSVSIVEDYSKEEKVQTTNQGAKKVDVRA